MKTRMDFAKMLETWRAFRAGAPLGDVVMLKLAALSPARGDLAIQIERLRDCAPEQNLSALRRLAPGTFGREYVRFLDDNSIEPLTVSASMRERFRSNPYALRYTTTHDLHHVLTGFDTGLAGEIGVLAFTIGQGSAPVKSSVLGIARVVYATLSPTQARTIWHNARIGLAMGKSADLVLAEPIESYFEEPLEAVRKKLRIADPEEARVLPSGSSLIAKLVYRSRPA
jgi:ubiquinone biosynthesis protein COQ4